jgi:mitochondrial FAD-linked sulfhydryl oxidase
MMRKSTSKPGESQTEATSTSATTAAAGRTLAGVGAAYEETQTQPDCPPDVDELGRNTWSLLHSMAATYPTTANTSMQSSMRAFISAFSNLYPCAVCADDFRSWMKEPGNEPRVGGQDELGQWLCEAHNAVNVKLGKGVFDCGLWKERWRDGWKDGRCD